MDGPTLTIVPRRLIFDPKMSLESSVVKVYEDGLAVGSHSQYGLRRILRSSGQSSALFDTLVNIVPGSEQMGSRQGIFKGFGPPSAWATGHTLLELQQRPHELHVRLHASIEVDLARQILRNFTNALHAIAGNPLQPAMDVVLSDPSDLELLAKPVRLAQDLPQHMLQEFDQMVQKHAQRAAIQWQALETISYEALDASSNQMAHLLLERGVRPGDFVCTLLRKSPRMIMAILGILKAGASYVPLSPDNPVDRNTFIIDEVRASVVLSEKGVAEDLSSCGAICLEDHDLHRFPRTATGIEIQSHDVAYVIYTSGSTGVPKGVVIQHGAAAAGISSMMQCEGRGIGEWRALQFSNCIFDASILDIFNTLNSGGTLCMAPEDRLLSQLADVINEMGVTHSFMTPTVARILQPADVPTLKHLTVGGEPLTDDIVETWCKNCQITQAYGPTETAMVAAMRRLSPDEANIRNLGPLFPTVAGYVLNPNSTSLVPYGAVGELCLAGPQLGKCYLNRPDLTSAAFVDVDIGGSSRIYRTGDLVRWLPGGELEILGRKDNQVKVNGHRIELSEIDQSIMATGAVSDCVTIVAHVHGKPQLASFAVFQPSGAAEGMILPAERFVENVNNLRRSLTTLAHYMRPSVLLPIGSMPLMPSGKAARKILHSWVEAMDSRALASYNLETFGDTVEVVATVSQAERFLETAFASVLKVAPDSIGREANFFALGGDSISAINLCAYVRIQQKSLSVSEIVRHPRLQDMALRLVDHAGQGHVTSSAGRQNELQNSALLAAMKIANIEQSDVEHAYICPPGQAEFLTQGTDPANYWVLMTVRSCPDTFDVSRWITAVEQLTEVEDILRTTFTSIQGVWYGVVLKSTKPTVDTLEYDDPVEKKLLLDQLFSANFEFGAPFIRYAIVKNRQSGALELATKLDHGLYDGTSLRIFDSHFRALQYGVELPGISQFRDYANYIAYEIPEKHEAALKYFTNPDRFSGVTPFPNIDAPAATSSVWVPGSVPGLGDLALQTGVTVPTLFQAAFQIWLARVTGQRQVSYDYLYTGRNIEIPHLNSQEVNGCTANFLPFHSTLGGSIEEYFQRTQADFWETTEHGVVGMDQIFRAAGLDRAVHGNRTLFLFQPFEPAAPSLGASGQGEDMKWVVMKGSEVTMVQPYGLVFEVHKTQAADEYRIKVTYDERSLTGSNVEQYAVDIWRILRKLRGKESSASVDECVGDSLDDA
ncbi:hypothetical protein GGR56DRAFT_623527 [Xylariaceae sp. FL0804]|nr:hypothetical protein GGR56DRAFT_623527 [Xylariaceae sp. FL0804]